MLTRTSVFLSIITLLTIPAAMGGCGDGDSGTTSGSGGAGGSMSSTDSGAGGASGQCYGDQTAWETAIMDPITCAKNSDCCVIVNGCTNAAQVVGMNKLSVAKGSWPYCDSQCTFCTTPAIAVECANNKCVGYQLPDDPSTPDELRKDHCGTDGPPLNMMNPASAFTCGG